MKQTDLLTLSQAIHSKTFWTAIVSAILTVVMAFGVNLSATQEKMILGAVAIIVSIVLGGSAVSYAHAKAAASLPPQQKSDKTTPPPTAM